MNLKKKLKHQPPALLTMLKYPFLRRKLFSKKKTVKIISYIWGSFLFCIGCLLFIDDRFENHNANANATQDSSTFDQLIAVRVIYKTLAGEDIFLYEDNYQELLNRLYVLNYLVEKPVMKLGKNKIHASMFSRFVGYSFGDNDHGKDICQRYNRSSLEIQAYDDLDYAAQHMESNMLTCFENTGRELNHKYFVGFKI